MTTVTVDLDYPTRVEILTAWHRVERVGDGRTRGRVSASGAGVHIQGQEILPENVPVNEKARRQCLDDSKRIDADLRQGLANNQVCFHRKGDKVAGEWLHTAEELIHEYTSSVEITPEALQFKEAKL